MAKKPSLTVVDPDRTGIQPPRKLGQYGLSLWHDIQSEYRIDDRGGIELLTQACGGVDRLEAITARINADGEVIATRTGLRSHPLIREETALRALICRTLEKLGIVSEKIQNVGRPGSGGWVE